VSPIRVARSNELTCRELVDLVTDYFEGALTIAERRRLEQHLATCLGCETYLEQMRQTIRATGRLREESLEPETRERAAEAISGLGSGWLRRCLPQ
jgi:anti-sigma factor RsiW